MKGLGLLALLVVMLILLSLYASSIRPAATVHKEVRPKVEQLAGVDAAGGRVSDSYTLSAVREGGKLYGLKVTQITPSSLMRSYYGLEEGDLIVESGGQGGVMFSARETDDADLLRAKVAEAYQYRQPLIVERRGKKLTLDGENKSTAPGTAGSPTGANKADPVQSQLDAIRNAAGGR